MVVVVSCNHFSDDERIYHKQIKSLLNTGSSILYFTRSDDQLDLSDGLLTHKNFSKNTSLSVFIETVTRSIKLNNKIQHIQIHETDLLPLFKKIKQHYSHINTIYDVHENMEALYRTFSNRRKLIKEILIKVRNYDEKKYLQYVDQIILANPPMEVELYTNKSTTVIENFPKIEYLDQPTSNIRRTKNSIIYHGHLAPERGIQDLVCAMKYASESISSISLSLLGTFRTEEFEHKIKSLIVDLGLENTITIFDQVPHSEIWPIIKEHSIGVIPFRRTPLTEENTPTKLFEMMICGLEIIVSKLPPAQYFLNDSVHWCEPGDIHSISNSIINACKMKDNFINVQKNFQLIQQEYNWEHRQDDYLALFSN